MIDSKPLHSVVPSHPVARQRTLHAIAAVEAIKGLAAFAAVVGVLDLMHHECGTLRWSSSGAFT